MARVVAILKRPFRTLFEVATYEKLLLRASGLRLRVGPLPSCLRCCSIWCVARMGDALFLPLEV
jgi:hypothetical protein